ncbi:MAG TPA: hypothetical protein VJ717_09410 [Gemmatimonadaceae bacterium]|nr:hypothetical protein [Gemmatimonadaceae bacterium]
MPCFVAVIALIAPRIVILALYFFTNWFVGMFDSLVWPILGFIFAPTSLLWYTAVQHFFGGVWTLWAVVGMVVAALLDLAPASGKR